jgi:predicted Zn finger-like uncharacterized protein
MPIATTCPSCHAMFRLADEMAGKRVRCQKCAGVFVVPAADSGMTMPGASVPAPQEPEHVDVPSDHTTADEAISATIDPPAPAPSWPLPSKSSAPPPVKSKDTRDYDEEDDRDDSGPKSRDPDRPRRRRREEPQGKSNSGTMTMIAVLAVGGVLAVCLCAGIIGVVVVANQGFGTQPIPVVFDANRSFQTNNRLSFSDSMERFDPMFHQPKRHKIYTVKLEAGQSYQIDMMANDFDAFLHLRDDRNEFVARDDDGGEGLNSRIHFRPQRSGTYRIYATSLDGSDTGSYTLIVRRL